MRGAVASNLIWFDLIWFVMCNSVRLTIAEFIVIIISWNSDSSKSPTDTVPAGSNCQKDILYHDRVFFFQFVLYHSYFKFFIIKWSADHALTLDIWVFVCNSLHHLPPDWLLLQHLCSFAYSALQIWILLLLLVEKETVGARYRR